MAKIIVLADLADEEAIKTALEGAGLECKVVEPTAKNLLHIAIGMVDDAPAEEPAEEPAPEETPPEETPPEDVPAEDVPPEEEVQEGLKSLGLVSVDGEQIQAFESKAETSALLVVGLIAGAKTTYSLNESTFSFWPANVAQPMQRITVEFNKHRTSLEVPIHGAQSTPCLMVGADLRDMFK